MRRLILFTAAFLLCAGLFAQQGKVTTRKYRLADFTDKITKVVMSGDEILDAALRQEVVDQWSASPFEFCSLDDYNALKGSDAWYFLLVTAGQAKGEEKPTVQFLTLEKGGAETGENIPLRTEILSLPLCPAEGGSGRELVFLPALVKGIQDFTLRAMASEKVAYTGTNWFNDNYDAKGRIKRIYLAWEDLSASVTEKDKARYLDEDIILCEADEADKVYADRTFNTLVSYSVSGGTWSYQLLVEAETDTIYYLRKHKVTTRSGAGFIADDLRKMAKGR